MPVPQSPPVPDTQPPTWASRLSSITGFILSHLQSAQMSLEELIQEPEFGVPIAIGLHVASLAAQVMLPGSPYAIPLFSSPYVPPPQRKGHSRLFAARPKAQHGYSAVLGRTIAIQRSAALRAMVRVC